MKYEMLRRSIRSERGELITLLAFVIAAALFAAAHYSVPRHIGPRIISRDSATFKEQCEKPCDEKCLRQSSGKETQDLTYSYYLEGCKEDCEDQCYERLMAAVCQDYCETECTSGNLASGLLTTAGAGCEEECLNKFCPDIETVVALDSALSEFKEKLKALGMTVPSLQLSDVASLMVDLERQQLTYFDRNKNPLMVLKPDSTGKHLIVDEAFAVAPEMQKTAPQRTIQKIAPLPWLNKTFLGTERVAP